MGDTLHDVTDATGATRAAGYVRVSQVGSRGGDSFLSPDLQRERIRAWAAYRQAVIVEWYTDLDISGRTGVYRPEFERMMVDARAGHFQIVAVYRLTRFGRSVKDTAGRYAELRDLGIGLVSVTEDIDTTTASGKFMQNMLFAMAEFESERIGEEWSSVHRNRRARGLHHASRGLIGYRVEGAVPVAIDDAEATAIRGMYHRRAAGMTLYAIRVWLHEDGHRPRGGGEWFAATSVRRILRNPAYAGLTLAGGDLIEASHPAIVPRELWDRVQALADASGPTRSRHRAGLVAGLVVCASCGYRMQAFHSRGEAHYRCSGYKMKHSCERPTQIAMGKLDEYVEGLLLRYFSGKRGRVGGDPARKRRERDRLEGRSRDLQRALDRLADERYILGSLDESEYARQVSRLIEDRVTVERELAGIVSEPVAPKVEVIAPDVWQRTPLAVRQRIARAAVESVVVEPIAKGGARWVKAEDRVRVEWR